MEEILRKVIDNHFADLAGLRVDASIPMSQTLVNEIVQAALRGQETIKSFEVDLHEQNRVSVRLKTSSLPWTLNLKLKLDGAVDFASFSPPKVRAWLENHRWLAGLGSFFHALPAWARLYGSQLVIDLGYFVRSPEQKKLLDLIKSVGIRTEEGKAILDLKIEVD